VLFLVHLAVKVVSGDPVEEEEVILALVEVDPLVTELGALWAVSE